MYEKHHETMYLLHNVMLSTLAGIESLGAIPWFPQLIFDLHWSSPIESCISNSYYHIYNCRVMVLSFCSLILLSYVLLNGWIFKPTIYKPFEGTRTVSIDEWFSRGYNTCCGNQTNSFCRPIFPDLGNYFMKEKCKILQVLYQSIV